MYLPPSPTPGSIVNQIDQSVQYYTGALNVSIPLHTLKSRSLELPISLSYNGSGVKVNDLSSWVGLGWSLNAGGVISRVMRGLPDEYTGQIWVGSRFVPSKGWLDPAVRGGTGMEIIDFFTSTSNNNRANTIEFSNKTGTTVYGGANPQTWDTEPDEFYFNFGKHSGKFIFDKTGAIQILPAQNLRITNVITSASELGAGTNSREITSFKVIDEAGIVYTFGNLNPTSISSLTAVERTVHHYFTQNILCGRRRLPPDTDFPNPEQFGNPESFRIYKWAVAPLLQLALNGDDEVEAVNPSYTKNYLPFTSTWHLSRIESPNEVDFIDLSYSNEDIRYFTSHNVDVSQDNLDFYQDDFPYPPEQPWKKKYFGSFRNWTTATHLNDEKGQTSFLFGNNVLNVAVPFYPQTTTISTAYNTVSAKRLNQIVDGAGNKVHFIATDLRADLKGSRLLNQIDIYNFTNQLVKSYRLDHGYTASAPLTEAGIIDIEFDQFMYWFPFPGSTGVGWWPITEWGLDANGDHNEGALPVHDGEWANIYFSTVDADYWRLYLMKIFESGDNWLSQQESFTFNYDTTEVLPRRLSPKQDLWGYYNQNTSGHTIPGFSYNTSWSSGQWVPFSSNTLWAFGSVNVALPFRQTTVLDANGDPILVDPEFKANRAPSLQRTQCGVLKEIYFPTGAKKVFTYELNAQGSVSKGGLRVTKIDDYPDKNTNNFIRRDIKYFDGVPSSQSIIYGESWDQDPLNIESIRNSITVSSAPMNFTPATKGGSVGYARVEEFIAGLGKTIFYFKNPTSDPDIAGTTLDVNANQCASCPSYGPQTDNDHSRGLLYKTEVLDNNNKLLKRSTTLYTVNPSGFTPKLTHALKAGVRFQFNSGNPLDNRKQFAGFYSYKHDFVSVQSQTEELYDQSDPGNESKKIVTSTDYSYILRNQTPATVAPDLLPRMVKQTLPNGDKVINETQYTIDYPISSTGTDERANGIFRLKEKKIENVPIETIQYLERQEGAQLNRYYLGGAVTTFKEFSGQTGKVYPWQQYQLKAGSVASFSSHGWSSISGTLFNWPGATLYKPVLTFNGYDNFGNPVSTTSADGLTNTYTWGYGNALLTSAIQNPGSFQFQTTYTHTPLIGVTQIMDPNSRNSRFTYDNFNRLKLVKDHSDQIVARYRYNYQNQNAYNQIDFTYATEYTTGTVNVIKFTALGGLEPGTSLSWDFGDDSGKDNGSNPEIKHYPVPGTFTVRLYATNPEYPTTSASKQVRILPPAIVQITSPSTGTNATVCGTAPVVCVATTTDGPYTFQWQYQYSGSGSSNYVNIGANSSTLNFAVGGAQGTSSLVRCRITDPAGNVRYSNTVIVFYYCNQGGGGGGGNCPPGWTWNPNTSQCDPPQTNCSEGCFWNGFECICP